MLPNPGRPTTRASLIRRAALLACVLAPLAACAPGSDLPVMPPTQNASYLLGSGDQIRIITFGEDQLTGQFRVDDAGNIAVPLIGEVHAAGLTPAGLQSRIAGELTSRKLLQNPSVSVEVLAYRPIFVLGEVARPGSYPYQPGMTMLTAVAVAGGFTYRAFEDYAEDVRTVGGKATTGKIMPDSFVAPGDVVNVYERHF